MKKRYKAPLIVNIIWHPSFKEGLVVADYMYNSFCRDTEAPLNRTIGIPVYYRSVPLNGQNKPLPLPLDDADYSAIVVLIDDCFFNDDNWNTYVKELVPKMNSKIRFFLVAFSSNAYYFEEATFGREQFINAKPINEVFEPVEFDSVLKKIRSNLLHGFCRLLLDKQPLHNVEEEINIPQPVKLFISHAKKDGEKDAEAFRDYVESTSKLNTFFDANDIADGYLFDNQIKGAITNGHAALVVFHSDAYATREWCQIEILTAKRYKAPIVVVHNIKKGEGRSFPYLGNVPTIKLLDRNFDEIIDLTLYQILINLYQSEYLRKVKTLYLPAKIESIHLTSPPELFNYIDIIRKKNKDKKKFVVIYPEPPLGTDEMMVLNDMDSDIQFLTPIQLSKLIK